MKFFDLLKLSTRMFKARTSRTLLTILGMSVGIAAILFLVSLGYGLQRTLLEKITTSDSLLTLDIAKNKSSELDLNREAISEIESMDGVAEVSKSFSLSSRGQMNDLSADLVVIGTQPSFLRLGGYKIIKGDPLSDDNKEGIVVASSVVQLFGSDADSIIGKEIIFSSFIPRNESDAEAEKAQIPVLNKRYVIIGIVESDENVVYIHSDSLSEIEVESYDGAKVRCSSDGKMNIVRDAIVEKGFSVSSLSDTVDQANKVFRVVQIVLMCFGVIALVVSAIGMFNTMTIALLERTNELGIMKSIGASNFSVSMMFIMESTIMGFLGGLGGIVVGLVEGLVFNGIVNVVATRMGGQAVSLFYSPAWFMGLIVIFAAFVGFATGIIPARRASKIDPLDALRYK
ncbi:MAG: ABC transporter permease [Parcubacteria group bacterium]|jgi:putative ABC transport system permease protein